LKNKENPGSPQFTVTRRDAEPLVYTSIEKIKEDYLADVLQPQALKPAVTEALLEILAPIKKTFDETKEWQEIEARAYPPPPAPAKKPKKEKNLGSRFPGGKGGAPAQVEAKPDGHLEGKDAEAIAIGKTKEEATGTSS
jgi:tyrosyl-tRNA synthetase